ncbi:MAG: nuclear transport factor 2 family protein [Burkholderiales bacterium]|nr:nuclear transport factor 2 family protein [Burkholderiales bacterium]
MTSQNKTLIELENRFWQSLVNQDTDTALELLSEPALMVSSHGAMKFDHAGYRKMAEQGSMVLTSFELSDMEVVFPNESTAILTYHVRQEMSPRGKSESATQEMNDTSTWVRQAGDWKCVMHTETPVDAKAAKH